MVEKLSSKKANDGIKDDYINFRNHIINISQDKKEKCA